jgi:hypothetical protein
MGKKKSNYLSLAQFPNSFSEPFSITSAETPQYNCVAWALDDMENWWEADEDYLWLDHLHWDNSLSTMQHFFQHFGFDPIDKPNFNNGIEKIALFSENGINCTHVAKQLPNNIWTSKLGVSHDVTHTLSAMEKGIYGDVAMILQKR